MNAMYSRICSYYRLPLKWHFVIWNSIDRTDVHDYTRCSFIQFVTREILTRNYGRFFMFFLMFVKKKNFEVHYFMCF